MKRRDIASYLFLALAWGSSFLVLIHVVAAFGWIGAVTFRALFAGLVLFALAFATGRRLDFSAGWLHFVIVGATTVAGQLISLSYAAPRIGTAMAAILVAAIPLFSMLLGQAFGLERIALRGIIGLVLGVAGIIMLVGFPVVPITPAFLFGCATSLFSSFAAAFGSNYANLKLKQAGAYEVTSAAFLTGGLMTLPLLIWVPVPTVPQVQDYLYLMILGGVMSALTYVQYFRLVATIGATRTISVEFVVTVVAVLIGSMVLGERLSLIQLVGGAVILFGCAIVLGLVKWPSEIETAS